ALVIALLGPWVWHWGPVVRNSAEAGPYRPEPAFETVDQPRRRARVPRPAGPGARRARRPAAAVRALRLRGHPRGRAARGAHAGGAEAGRGLAQSPRPDILLARDDERAPQPDPAPAARRLRAARPTRPAARR